MPEILLEILQGMNYNLIHSKLRDKSIGICEEEIQINTELVKFNRLNNQIIYRGEYAEIDFTLFWFQDNLNKIICFPSFLHCSILDWPLKNYPIKFIIQTTGNSKCHDTSNIKGRINSEMEVIFESKACFTIKNLNKKEHIIYLEETNLDADFVIYSEECYFQNPRNVKNYICSSNK